MSILSALIGPATDLAGKFIQDKDAAAKMAHELATLADKHGSGGHAGADRGQQSRSFWQLVSSVVASALRLCVRSGAGGKLPDLANGSGVWVHGSASRYVGNDASANGYARIGRNEII